MWCFIPVLSPIQLHAKNRSLVLPAIVSSSPTCTTNFLNLARMRKTCSTLHSGSPTRMLFFHMQPILFFPYSLQNSNLLGFILWGDSKLAAGLSSQAHKVHARHHSHTAISNKKFKGRWFVLPFSTTTKYQVLISFIFWLVRIEAFSLTTAL